MDLIATNFPVGLLYPVSPSPIYPLWCCLGIFLKHNFNHVITLLKILSWLPCAFRMKHSFLQVACTLADCHLSPALPWYLLWSRSSYQDPRALSCTCCPIPFSCRAATYLYSVAHSPPSFWGILPLHPLLHKSRFFQASELCLCMSVISLSPTLMALFS